MSEHDDLNWLAFRYVAGELTAPELRAFETQLEDDQRAREAVARACELTCCIAAAEQHRFAAPLLTPVTVPGQGVTPWPPVSVIALSLAVGLLLLLTALQLPRPESGGQTVTLPRAEPVDTDQVAEIWSASRQALDDPLWLAEPLDDDNADLPIALAAPPPDDGSTYWIETAVFGLAAAGNKQ